MKQIRLRVPKSFWFGLGSYTDVGLSVSVVAYIIDLVSSWDAPPVCTKAGQIVPVQSAFHPSDVPHDPESTSAKWEPIFKAYGTANPPVLRSCLTEY